MSWVVQAQSAHNIYVTVERAEALQSSDPLLSSRVDMPSLLFPLCRHQHFWKLSSQISRRLLVSDAFCAWSRGYRRLVTVESNSVTDENQEEDAADATGPQQEYWPDGTPKHFSGAESWKNWIDWDSKYQNLTDQLNRARHFFFEVDAKGRVFRLELDRPGDQFGQIRDGSLLSWNSDV